MSKAPGYRKYRSNRRRSSSRLRSKKRDPLCENGKRMRPVFLDYKDVEKLKKLTNRQGKIISRRKTGCSAISQHAVAAAVKRARFMALMPFVSD
ncbi:MAG: 30S ribosomal protein S18 [Thermoguttaceae bacterium]|jgi:small subunit ribosomal protein S18